LGEPLGAPHTRAMASSPMHKLSKTGAVDQDGNVVTIPRLPPVAGANKPLGWDRLSDAEKVQHLLGLSLDARGSPPWTPGTTAPQPSVWVVIGR